MIKQIFIAILFFELLQFSPAAIAGRDCFEERPRFNVGDEFIWDGLITAAELFQQAQKIKIPNAKEINAEGIWLPDLIRQYAKKGTLLIKSCGHQSFSVDIEDLLSGDTEKSAYYLALTKKKTLKVMFAVGTGPAKTDLKRVSMLKISGF